MKGKEMIAKLLEKPTKADIERLYKEFNVNRERVNLYKYFIINLSKKVYETYLGKDCLKTKEDIKGHFEWCFNTNLTEFENIGFKFNKTEEIYDYFLEYYDTTIYSCGDQDDFTFENDKKYIENIFQYDFNASKNNLKLFTMVEFYAIFEKSFNKFITEKSYAKKRILITTAIK